MLMRCTRQKNYWTPILSGEMVYNEIGDGYIAENITNWMLLPKPPEGEEDT